VSAETNEKQSFSSLPMPNRILYS